MYSLNICPLTHYIMDWNARNKASLKNIIEENCTLFVGIVQNSSLDYTKYSVCNAVANRDTIFENHYFSDMDPFGCWN